MFSRKTLYTGTSEYGSYKIVDMRYDGRLARVLFGDSKTPQSGTALDDSAELLFNYNQRFLEMVQSQQPSKVLVIGGGVMMLPIALLERFPDIKVDVVEIDPLLIELAYEYFDAPHDARLRTFVQDGKKYMESTHEKYDMILIDAFSGYSIPAHLLDSSAVSLYKKHLTDGGVLGINALSRITSFKRQFAKEVCTTFEEVFAHTAVFQADPDYGYKDEQNVLIVASNTEISFDYLQSVDVRESL
jgi:spermidine synthase